MAETEVPDLVSAAFEGAFGVVPRPGPFLEEVALVLASAQTLVCAPRTSSFDPRFDVDEETDFRMAAAMALLPVIAKDVSEWFGKEDFVGLQAALVRWLEVLAVLELPQVLAVDFMKQLLEEVMEQQQLDEGPDHDSI